VRTLGVERGEGNRLGSNGLTWTLGSRTGSSGDMTSSDSSRFPRAEEPKKGCSFLPLCHEGCLDIGRGSKASNSGCCIGENSDVEATDWA